MELELIYLGSELNYLEFELLYLEFAFIYLELELIYMGLESLYLELELIYMELELTYLESELKSLEIRVHFSPYCNSSGSVVPKWFTPFKEHWNERTECNNILPQQLLLIGYESE